ncbi:MAG: OmpH family outer membrane protein [Thermodesulfobacteriota bacterium]
MIFRRCPATPGRIPSGRALLVLAALAALLLFPAPGRAEGKVGFIDPVRVLNESRLGKLAKRDLARAKREKEKVLQHSQERLAALESGLPQPSADGTMSPASTKAIEAQRDRHNRLRSEISQDLDQESQALLAVVVANVDRVLEALAKRRGFTLVLKDANVVAFVAPDYDLTDDVIRTLDQGN